MLIINVILYPVKHNFYKFPLFYNIYNNNYVTMVTTLPGFSPCVFTDKLLLLKKLLLSVERT
jgi:hypothetical protein